MAEITGSTGARSSSDDHQRIPEHELRQELFGRELWHRREWLGFDEEVALNLAVPPPAEQRNDVLSRPNSWPELLELEPDFLASLATQRVLVCCAGLDAASGHASDGIPAKFSLTETKRHWRLCVGR